MQPDNVASRQMCRAGYTPARMPITPLTAPPIDRNRARVDPSCIRRPSAFAAIFAMVTGAFLAGCGKPVKQVAEAAPAPLTEVAMHQR